MKTRAINPAKIAKELDIFLSSSARAFQDLAKRDLIVCLNPKSTSYKLYKLTKTGQKVLRKAESL